MSRKPTPPPESGFLGLGAVIVVVMALPALALWLVFDRDWLLLPAIPLVLYVADLTYGVLLLLAAWLRWRGTGIRGVLVTSDSPNWREYIEQQWLPRLASRVVVLNWSQRRTWRLSLAVLLFRRFGLPGSAGWGTPAAAYNPLLICTRGLRYPLVYRYYYAFRDAKHGNRRALQRLEADMFSQIQADAGTTG